MDPAVSSAVFEQDEILLGGMGMISPMPSYAPACPIGNLDIPLLNNRCKSEHPHLKLGGPGHGLVRVQWRLLAFLKPLLFNPSPPRNNPSLPPNHPPLYCLVTVVSIY